MPISEVNETGFPGNGRVVGGSSLEDIGSRVAPKELFYLSARLVRRIGRTGWERIGSGKFDRTRVA